MDLPTVINRHHFKGNDDLPKPWLYVGRGTPLGNPYLLKDHGEERCLALFRKWLWEKIRQHDKAVLEQLRVITAQHHLVCSCKPGPCHGDVIVQAWKWCVERGVVRGETYEDAERAALADPRFH